MKYNLLYRGSLSSCNYTCDYCPFALSHDNKVAREQDEQALSKFINWVDERRQDNISILFTPWGEGLVRKWYQHALIDLSNFPQVNKVAIQTNLSCKLDWLEQVDQDCFALWISYHPSQISLPSFIKKCEQLNAMGIAYSVGIVATDDSINIIGKLRSALREDIYLWINADKENAVIYTSEQIELMQSVDPLFKYNIVEHDSFRKRCQTGKDTFSISHNGDITRCHFVDERLGNIYKNDISELTTQQTCPRQSCDCYIGYAHLEHLPIRTIMQAGVLERVPVTNLTTAMNSKVSETV